MDCISSVVGVPNNDVNVAQKLGFEKSVSDTKPISVSDTCVSDTQNTTNPSAGTGLPSQEVGESKGSLIISLLSDTPTDRNKPKKCKNRKTPVTGQHFEHGGEYFEVNTRSKDGEKQYKIYAEIMKRIIDQMRTAFAIHGRLFVQHFVLSTSYYTETNTEWTKLRKSLMIGLQRKFGAKKNGYVWVREQETVKKQHYHVFIAVDGQKVWFKDGFTEMIKEMVFRSDYFTSVSLASFHQVDDQRSFKEMIYHASYLAKTRGKGWRHERANDFGGSQLRPVKQAGSRG